MLDSLEVISNQKLLGFSAAETIVVTVNNRMAIHLKQDLIAAHRGASKVFEIAQVQPWTHFLEYLHERAVFALKQVPATKQLSSFAALLYWEAILQEQQLTTLNLTKLARVLADAHTLQLEWGIEVEELEETPEYLEYKKIKTQYLNRLEQRDAIDGPLKEQWLLTQLERSAELYKEAGLGTQAVESGVTQLRTNVAKKIVLQGFRELSAIQSGLLAACRDLGAELYLLEDEIEVASQLQLQVLSAQNRAEELEAAVSWAKAKLAANPSGRFAIIDPLLQTELNTVRRYLHEHIQDGGLKAEMLYNVAIGRPLNDWAIVRSALAWLSLFIKLSQTNRISTQAFGEALLLGQEALVSNWADPLSAIDVRLREDSKISYHKHKVQQFFNEVSDEFSELTQQAFGLFADKRDLRLRQWLQTFKEFLALFTFPGLHGLSSAQYQVCTAFEQALKTTTALSSALEEMSVMDAFSLLERVCRQQIFQPQRAASARLDVLGVLEAEGAKWDAVWIMSMQDDVLPTVPKPNPLIPKVALQRVGAPRSDHQREFQWAEAMLSSLLKTAPEINISWHAFAGEMPTKPSPLLGQYSEEEKAVAIEEFEVLHGSSKEMVQLKSELEYLKDDYGPSIPKGEILSGGSRLVDLQSKNPQWAFAVYRLHMREFSSYPRYELDRMQRGIFIHDALERFWDEVREQSELKAMSDDALKEKIALVVDASASSELLFDSRALLELEKEFVKNQLFHFLKLEQERELEFRVAEVEKNVEISLAKIKLRVKIDRIDYLENDSYLYLDYKTGNLPAYKKNWYRERPTDLQLPLYAAYGDYSVSEVGGVGFAGLKPGRMGFAGIGSVNWALVTRSGVEEKSAVDFEQQLNDWKAKLMILADEIARGYAANCYADPKDMEYCEVLPFLRLEQDVEEEENEND
jgi:probable DNA repair protein